MSQMFGCCFPFLGKKPAGQDDVQQRQTLLGSAAQGKVDEPSLPMVDLRRIFSRTDISEIPENAEVHRGADTHHSTAAAADGAAPVAAQPPPSPLPGPPSSKELERLFSRGAVRSSPLGLNRLFSRGAVVRTSSNLSLNRSNNHPSTTEDSQADDYGEDRVETVTELNTPLLNNTRRLMNESPMRVAAGSSPRMEDVLAAAFPVMDESRTLVSRSSSSTSYRISKRKLPELANELKKLKDVADHLVPASLTAVTADHEDHTFSGIYFDVKARTLVPCAFLEIQSISVRGKLGTISIYSTEGSYEGKQSRPKEWTRHFGPFFLEPSIDRFWEIILNVPIRLSPGTTKGIYVHSELLGDEAIVYNEQHSASFTYEDNCLRIFSGMAHVSNVPFEPRSQWGGSAYRKPREFAGILRYGAKVMMWTPEIHHHFPSSFRRAVNTIMLCHKRLGAESNTIGALPTAVLFSILNMLPYDWFPLEFNAYDSDTEVQGEEGQQFQYGGHVGRIAELRQLFDAARAETLAADPLAAPEITRVMSGDTDGDDGRPLSSEAFAVPPSHVDGGEETR